jgi:hypothetical protein
LVGVGLLGSGLVLVDVVGRRRLIGSGLVLRYRSFVVLDGAQEHVC